MEGGSSGGGGRGRRGRRNRRGKGAAAAAASSSCFVARRLFFFFFFFFFPFFFFLLAVIRVAVKLQVEPPEGLAHRGSGVPRDRLPPGRDDEVEEPACGEGRRGAAAAVAVEDAEEGEAGG